MLKYRKDIDGLRGLSVMGVILFHSNVNLISGGFVGVDIFFVISGYLITTIIISELNYKKFSFIKFYERRIRRIFPALFFVLTICIPFSWFFMLPSEMIFFSKSLISVAIFFSNIFFWKNTNYFATRTDEYPLIHTWSLSVEEQFYFIFPIFLFLIFSFFQNRQFFIILIFTLLSFAICIWASHKAPVGNFYLLPSRAWEFFCGSLCAYTLTKNKIKENNFISFVGLILIIIAMIFYQNLSYPSHYTLLPVFGTMLIIIFNNSKTIAFRLLSLKLLVSIGLISYSAYLWHQPIFAYYRIISFNSPSNFLFLIFITLIISYFSYKFIEKPFRNNSVSLKSILILSALFIILLTSYGYFGIKTNGYEKRFDFKEPFSPISDLKCQGSDPDIKSCLKLSDDKRNIVILGDSHAAQTYVAIKQKFSELPQQQYSLSFINLQNDNNFPYSFIKNNNLNFLNDEIIKRLLKEINKNDVLIFSIYHGRLKENKNLINFFDNFKVLLKELKTKHINIVFQMDVPSLPSSKWIHCYKDFEQGIINKCSISKKDFIQQQKKFNLALQKTCTKKLNCRIFEVESLFFKKNEIFNPLENMSYVDTNHLSMNELKNLGNLFFKLMNENKLMQ